MIPGKLYLFWGIEVSTRKNPAIRIPFTPPRFFTSSIRMQAAR